VRGTLCNHNHCKLTECRVHCVSVWRRSANSHGIDRHDRHAAVTRTGADGGEGGRGGCARSFQSDASKLERAEKAISIHYGKNAHVLFIYFAQGQARCDTVVHVVVPSPMHREK